VENRNFLNNICPDVSAAASESCQCRVVASPTSYLLPIQSASENSRKESDEETSKFPHPALATLRLL